MEPTIRTTGKFDLHGEEVFEGDKVLIGCGLSTIDGKRRALFKIFTITYVEREVSNGVEQLFNLGGTYNNWKGKDVQRLTDEQVKEMGIEEGVRFYFDDNDNAIQHKIKIWSPLRT